MRAQTDSAGNDLENPDAALLSFLYEAHVFPWDAAFAFHFFCLAFNLDSLFLPFFFGICLAFGGLELSRFEPLSGQGLFFA